MSRVTGASQTDPRPPAIVLGVGISALGALRILARNRIPVFVANSEATLIRRSRWFRAIGQAPPLGDQALSAWLSALPIERGVLIPCSDHMAMEAASLSPELRQRFPVSAPAPEILGAFVDKGLFARMLQDNDIPHPFSQAVDGAAALESVPASIFESAILKPRDSQLFMRRFGVKAIHVSSRPDAAEKLAQMEAAGLSMILQEYVPGPPTSHYFVDGFIDRTGVVRATFVRRRLRMYPFDFGNSTALVSVPPNEAESAVHAIVRLLGVVGYRGVFSGEFKRDERTGVFKLLEINTRAWWFVDFAARSGVDVCRMMYDDALDRAVGSVTHYDVGRTLVHPYYDYFACREPHHGKNLSLTTWVRSLLGAQQPLFQLQDPLPGLADASSTLARALRSRLLPRPKKAPA